MQSFLKDEYGTGGKGFTIDGQKISIWYDNDGIRIRRGDSARRNFDRIVTWEEAADRIQDMYEEGNYVDNLISNNAIEQEQKEMTDLLALHFRDTSRNREEQLSYSDCYPPKYALQNSQCTVHVSARHSILHNRVLSDGN